MERPGHRIATLAVRASLAAAATYKNRISKTVFAIVVAPVVWSQNPTVPNAANSAVNSAQNIENRKTGVVLRVVVK